MLRHRPFVLWKYAATLDGRIAAADGTSRWISSPQSRADVHRLRAAADAVIVGSGTARADDPQLGARIAGLSDDEISQPLRVVVDSGATAVKAYARVLDGTAPTLIAVAEDADASRLEGLAPIIRLPRADDGRGLDLPALLQALYEREVRSVLLEGDRRSPVPSSPPRPSTRSSAISPRYCSAPDRPPSGTPESAPSPRRCGSM